MNPKAIIEGVFQALGKEEAILFFRAYRERLEGQIGKYRGVYQLSKKKGLSLNAPEDEFRTKLAVGREIDLFLMNGDNINRRDEEILSAL